MQRGLSLSEIGALSDETKVLFVERLSATALPHQRYSPEQVVGYAKRHNIPCVSITTIYKYIWTDNNHYCSSQKLFHHLRIVRKKAIRRCGERNRLGIIPEREMIDLRLEIVEQRTRFGDFEADTMWIADKAVIVTVNDRATHGKEARTRIQTGYTVNISLETQNQNH